MNPSPLEHLRIVSETAAYLRAEPESRAGQRRRDEFVRLAARHHSAREIAEAAGLTAEQVVQIVMVGVPVQAESPKPPAREAGVRRAVTRRFSPGGGPSPAGASSPE